MTIRPINGVSFRNNYNQINFEGKKKSENSRMQIPASIKAIPLATVIAMSPLNNVQAQNTGKTEELVNIVQFDDKPNGGLGNVLLMCYDTDGDENTIEKILFGVSYDKAIKTKNWHTYEECEPKVLKKVKISYVDDYSKGTRMEYYVVGPGQKEVTTTVKATGKKTEKVTKSNEKSIKISEEAYNYLKQIYGDGIEYRYSEKEADERTSMGIMLEGAFD